MEEKELRGLLIEILYASLNEVTVDASVKDALTPDVLETLYRLAKKQDLAHIVSSFVYQNGVSVPPELQAKLQKEEMLSIYRCERLDYALAEICEAFDAAHIAHIPLKGSVIRPYYPTASMRTSCDVDVLIHKQDLETAIAALAQKGYRCGERKYHDVHLYSPSNIHLELHFHIQEDMDRLDEILKNAWDYAHPVCANRYAFSDEFFVYYLFAHMTYHFLGGGCGIRSLMDIWVVEHKMGLSYSCAEELLKKAGIDRFAAEMREIAEQCFTHRMRSASAETILKYIFEGGLYGNMEHYIAVTKSKGTNATAYILQRIFLPYRSMKISYPILVKVPILLPFCWIARWFSLIFGRKTKRVMRELATVKHMTDHKVEEAEAIRLQMGL